MTSITAKRIVGTNYCKDFAQVLNVSNLHVTSRNMLKGRIIKVGVNIDTSPLMMTFSPQSVFGSPYVPTGGILYLLQQEIARRGGFTIQYVNVDNYGSFHDTEQFLTNILPYCDIYGGNVIVDTSKRRDLSIDFTTRVLDTSIVMVTSSQWIHPFQLWSFALPFEPALWGVFVLVAIFHAFYFYFTEAFYSIEKDEEVELTPMYTPLTLQDSLYDSLQLEGDPGIILYYNYCDSHIPINNSLWVSMRDEETFGLDPHTIASSFVKLGYGLFLFVMIASYGANLANIYIKAQTPQIPVSSILDANDKNAIVCATTGNNDWCTDCAPWSATPFAVINTTYPSIQLAWINSTNPTDLLTAINNGTCAAAVMTAYDWDSVQNFKTANTGCYIVEMPATSPANIIRSSIGSFPCLLDYDVLCTSAVQVVWSTILNEMYEDGGFQAIYQTWITQRTDSNCPASQVTQASIVLDFTDLAGIFVVLAAAMGLGILVEMFPSLIPSFGFVNGRPRTPNMVRNLYRKMSRTGGVDPDIDPINRIDDRGVGGVDGRERGGLGRAPSRTFLTRVGSRRMQGRLPRQQPQQQQPQQTTANLRDDNDDDDDNIRLDRNIDIDSEYGSQPAAVEQGNSGAWTGASIVGMFYPSNYGLDLAPLNQQQKKQQQKQQKQQQQLQEQEKGTRARSRKQVDDWLFGVEGPLPYRGEEEE